MQLAYARCVFILLVQLLTENYLQITIVPLTFGRRFRTHPDASHRGYVKRNFFQYFIRSLLKRKHHYQWKDIFCFRKIIFAATLSLMDERFEFDVGYISDRYTYESILCLKTKFFSILTVNMKCTY